MSFESLFGVHQAAYGRGHMFTPNLDKLAQTSLVFQHAYTQYASTLLSLHTHGPPVPASTTTLS